MLQIRSLQNPQEWKDYTKDFHPEKQTWVVADLKTKFEVQQHLFNTYDVLPEESVLRASELWTHMYKRVGAEHQVISLTFAKIYLHEQLQKEEEPWLKVPGAHKTLLAFIHQLFPLIIYPNVDDLIKPWWEENTGALIRWGRWFYYAQKYVHHFLDRGWVLQSWIPAILINNYSKETHWDKKIEKHIFAPQMVA